MRGCGLLDFRGNRQRSRASSRKLRELLDLGNQQSGMVIMTTRKSKQAIPAVQGLYETHLMVENLKVSVSFYQNVVGLEVATIVDDRIAFLWVEEKRTGMLGLWQSGNAPLGLRLHIAFKVSLEGVLKSAADLKSHGVQALGFNKEPLDEPIVLGWMPAVAQYFSDPDGHLIEFIHILEESADSKFGVQTYSKWLARGTSRS
jgi:lactoylglutathione lyase